MIPDPFGPEAAALHGWDAETVERLRAAARPTKPAPRIPRGGCGGCAACKNYKVTR